MRSDLFLSDGYGPFPDGDDKALEWLFVSVVAVGVGAGLVFTGLDAHVEYVLTNPAGYAGLSAASNGSTGDGVVFTQDQLQGIEFSTKNRIGYDTVGDEIGICGDLRSDGSVSELRVADGFEETSRTSVTFSCANPRSLILHSQPGYSDQQSAEDKSFKGEFAPEISCIVYSEPVVSPLGGLEGINCFEAGTDNSVSVSVE